jgi:hypothetical protein
LLTYGRPTPPLKVRMFTTLMLMDRILTHDTMTSRGMQCDTHCVLCEACQWETELHVFFKCRYALIIWRGIERNKDQKMMIIGNSIEQTWDRSWREARRGGTMTRKKWAPIFMCEIWNLLKQRNEHQRCN